MSSTPNQDPLPIIKFAKLLSKTSRAIEAARLFAAATSEGFFYLDLDATNHGCIGDGLEATPARTLKESDQIFSLMKTVFDLSIEEKKEYDVSKNGGYFGYKGVGMSFIDERGTPDTNEFFNISKDDMLDQNGGRLKQPQVLENNRVLLRSFITHCHQIATVLLRELSAALKLEPISAADQPSSDVLPSLHRLTAASEDQISMIKYPVPATASASPSQPQPQPLASHTDYGSITILFTSSPGLQVLQKPTLPDSPTAAGGGGGHWHDIAPKPAHAIVNCGDALALLSGHTIRSNVHRVTSHAARGSTTTRYSLGYFVRPENDRVLRPLRSPLIDVKKKRKMANDSEGEGEGEGEEEGGVRTKEWILRRSYGRLLERYQGRESWAATAGTEKV